MPKECVKLTEKTPEISFCYKIFSDCSDPGLDSNQSSLISLEEIKSDFFKTT